MPTPIVFETHSWSEDNDYGIATGWLLGRLSERGRQLASELGKRRRNDRLTAVFTSDLYRAVENTEIAFADSGLPIFHDWRLRECDYGDLNGHPASRVLAQRQDRTTTPYPGGEKLGTGPAKSLWLPGRRDDPVGRSPGSGRRPCRDALGL